MKKLLTICLLLATTFTVKAQQMNFEETVNYINDIFKENKIAYYNGDSLTGRYVKGISADKTGKVIIYDKYKSNNLEADKLDAIMNSINLFDISSYHYYQSFRLIGAEDSNGRYNNIGNFNEISGPVAGRLEKALTHLRSLCNNKADPFGN